MNNTTSILVQDKVVIHHKSLATNWRMELLVNLIETHYYVIVFPLHSYHLQAYQLVALTQIHSIAA